MYYSSHDTLHFDYTENVGRDGKYANDFSSEFEIFRFINTRKWKVQENVPQIIYLPYKRTDLRKSNKKLRIAVIPGINEKNLEFSTTKGSGYRVDYSRTNQKAIKNKITKYVEKVLKTGYDIMVFPEYITSPQFFSALQRKKSYGKNVRKR